MAKFQKVKIGDVLTERREVPDLFDVESGAISVVSKIGFAQGKIELRAEGGTKTGMILIRPGDLVLSGINAAKGAIAICDERAENPIAATIHYSSYIPNKQKVDIRYLWWFFRSNFFREILMQNLPGGIKTELKASRFLPLEIPLPPLTEQQHILARLEALAARIESARRLRQEAGEEAKALMASELSAITQDLLAKYSHQNLEFLTTFIGDMNHEMPQGIEEGIPFISPKDFSINRSINFDNSKKISIEDFTRLSKKCKPQKGDILMARYGTIGEARFVNTDREFLASYSIAVIRPDTTKVDEKFLFWLIVSPYTQKQAIRGIRGSGMADLGLKTICLFEIPVPPLAEQRRAVAYLDGLQAQVSALRAAQAETGKELSALMPSILDKAFKGELLDDPVTIKVAQKKTSYLCLLGAVAGDIIGSVYEFNAPKSTEFVMFTPDSQITDDSILTIAVADAIVNGRSYLECIRDYALKYPNSGYGGMFCQWMHAENPQPYNSFGNGSAMRVSPVGWAFETLEETLRQAEASAAITHNHPEGIKGAQAVALAIFRARNGSTKDDIRKEITERFGYDLSRTVDEIRPTYTFDETCQKTVPPAIVSFLESENFEDAIRKAVSLGGDADTLAAITGSIAEAFYGGVPQEIVTEFHKRVPKELWDVVERFSQKYAGSANAVRAG